MSREAIYSRTSPTGPPCTQFGPPWKFQDLHVYKPDPPSWIQPSLPRMGSGSPTRSLDTPGQNMPLGPTLDLGRGPMTPHGRWAHGANLRMEARPQPALNARQPRRALTKRRALTGLWQVYVTVRVLSRHIVALQRRALNSHSELHTLSRSMCHTRGRHHHGVSFGWVMCSLQWSTGRDNIGGCARSYARRRASLRCNPYL
jgi:hypothetical protein